MKLTWLRRIALTLVGLALPSLAQTPADIVDRAHAAHGGRWRSGQIQDWTMEGKITYFTLSGPQATFDLLLFGQGRSRLQRIIKQPTEVRQGTDGTRSWDSLGGRFAPFAQGGAARFIESQTARSIQVLFNHQSEGLRLQDLGQRGSFRVIEAEDRSGRRTKYFIDSSSLLVSRLEFDRGEWRDPFSGRRAPLVEAYLFSDFRNVQGVVAAFKVERFVGEAKAEEMLFSRVQFNTGLKDEIFRP